jgi:hypothetical protein
MEFDPAATLGLVAELAVALAGFSGVVVAFGSRRKESWEPGDRLRLHFLVESSLTAGGFALLALVLVHSMPEQLPAVWIMVGIAWAVFMPGSLYNAHRRLSQSALEHGDVDSKTNGIVFVSFSLAICLQIVNVLHWQAFGPLLAALSLNLVGAGMQFAHLINSAFHN